MGSDFMVTEVLKPSQYFYLGAHSATYLTIICMHNLYLTDFPDLVCVFCAIKHKTDEPVSGWGFTPGPSHPLTVGSLRLILRSGTDHVILLLVRERSALADPYCHSAWNSVCVYVCDFEVKYLKNQRSQSKSYYGELIGNWWGATDW